MPWLVTIGFILLWQGFVDLFRIQSFVLPSPWAGSVIICALGKRPLARASGVVSGLV